MKAPARAGGPRARYAFFKYGASLATRRLAPSLATTCISANMRLTRADLRRRRWLFPIFVRNNLPVLV